MSLIFEYYWPLVFFLAIPVLIWARRQSAVDLSPKHLRLSLWIRCVLIAFLALALMQPSLLRSSSRVATVYLLDVSQSVSPNAVQDGLAWIRKISSGGGTSRFLAFGANSLAFDTTEALAKVPVSSKPQPDAIDQSKTALAAALNHAARSFPPDHVKHLVLLSDGNGNSGDLTSALEHLRLENIHVYTRPLAVRAAKDTWIETIMAPATVTAEEQFPVEVHVYTQKATPAEIQLRNGDKLLEKRSVKLTEGLNRIAFATSVKDESTTIVLDATVTVAGDPLPANNTFRKAATVLGKQHILYVEGYSPSEQYLT